MTHKGMCSVLVLHCRCCAGCIKHMVFIAKYCDLFVENGQTWLMHCAVSIISDQLSCTAALALP